MGTTADTTKLPNIFDGNLRAIDWEVYATADIFDRGLEPGEWATFVVDLDGGDLPERARPFAYFDRYRLINLTSTLAAALGDEHPVAVALVALELSDDASEAERPPALLGAWRRFDRPGPPMTLDPVTEQVAKLTFDLELPAEPAFDGIPSRVDFVLDYELLVGLLSQLLHALLGSQHAVYIAACELLEEAVA